MYVRVRRACMVEGMSIREADRVFGLHRDTGAQDADVFGASRIPSRASSAASEAGAVYGGDRSDTGRGTGPPQEATPHGQARAILDGVEQRVDYFVLDLPHSDGCFVKAYPAETTEAFCDGHMSGDR